MKNPSLTNFLPWLQSQQARQNTRYDQLRRGDKARTRNKKYAQMNRTLQAYRRRFDVRIPCSGHLRTRRTGISKQVSQCTTMMTFQVNGHTNISDTTRVLSRAVPENRTGRRLPNAVLLLTSRRQCKFRCRTTLHSCQDHSHQYRYCDHHTTPDGISQWIEMASVVAVTCTDFTYIHTVKPPITPWGFILSTYL